jgi:hypothetical protein
MPNSPNSITNQPDPYLTPCHGSLGAQYRGLRPLGVRARLVTPDEKSAGRSRRPLGLIIKALQLTNSPWRFSPAPSLVPPWNRRSPVLRGRFSHVRNPRR